MKVILLDNVRGLGQKGDLKEVKPGYGQNFLIKNGLAKLATETIVNEKQGDDANKERSLKEQQDALHAKIKTLPAFSFSLKTGKDGSVFGSITKPEIIKSIETHSAPYRINDIVLNNSMKVKGLKELGEHQVKIKWQVKEVVSKHTLTVQPE